MKIDELIVFLQKIKKNALRVELAAEVRGIEIGFDKVLIKYTNENTDFVMWHPLKMRSHEAESLRQHQEA